MSDFNSGLPVRTQNNGDVVVKVGDGTTPSQQLAVDSSGRIIAKIEATNGDALTDTSGSLNVNVTNAIASGVADKTTFTYGTTAELPIGGVFQDTSPTLTAGQTGAVRLTTNRGFHVNLRDAAGNEKLGQLTMANSIPVAIASDQSALPVSQSGTWTVQPGNTQNSTAWLTQDAADGPVSPGSVAAKSILTGGQFNTVLPTLTNTQQAALQVDASGRIIIRPLTATDVVTVTQGTAASVGSGWPVNPVVAGAAVSATNPFPVYLQDGGASVNDYVTAAAVAAAGTSNHDYTVTAAKTLHLSQIHVTGSGKVKAELQIETGVASGSFNTKYVGFNSTANPGIDFALTADIQVAAGVRVRIIRTNNDTASQDLYSTISGHEQ